MYTINYYRNNLLLVPSYGDFCTLNTYSGQMSGGKLSYYRDQCLLHDLYNCPRYLMAGGCILFCGMIAKGARQKILHLDPPPP